MLTYILVYLLEKPLKPLNPYIINTKKIVIGFMLTRQIRFILTRQTSFTRDI